MRSDGVWMYIIGRIEMKGREREVVVRLVRRLLLRLRMKTIGCRKERLEGNVRVNSVIFGNLCIW